MDQCLDLVEQLVLVRQVEGLQGHGEGGVVTTHPPDGGLESLETLVRQFGGQFRAQPRSDGGLVGDDAPARLEHRLDEGVCVVGVESLEVDDFHRDAYLLGHSGRFPHHYHLGTPGDHGDVTALLGHVGLVQV